MESEQDEKAMGANTLAYVEGEVRARAHDHDPGVLEALSNQDYRQAVALSARAHGAAVGRMCMALVGSQAEAQELAQETFVAAYKAFQSYRGDGTVRAFLYGIARRMCSRHVELRVRRDAKLRLVHDVGPVEADAAEMVGLRQRAERARTALDGLRPTERDAVVLRFQGELSFREVAEACGIDEATARKRVSRAIARLRTSLGDS
jgi:RNA polymerase sigma-70 factor, ECF subfamily